jgi:hypothetical protein
MYTTKLLLDIMADVMPRRQRIVLGAITAFLTIGSIVGSVSSRPAERTVIVTRPAIILIATPTPAAPTAAPESAVRVLAAPTAAPLLPSGDTGSAQTTRAPAYQIGERTTDKLAPPRSHERPSDKLGPGGE